MRDLKHLIYFENLLQQANNDLVQDACKDGRLALAWNCSYIPEVLLDTDNCFGVRLRAPNCTNPDMATYYMTNRSCPYSKSILERAFEGGYNFISALIGQECCTTMNRMEQSLREDSDFLDDMARQALSEAETTVRLRTPGEEDIWKLQPAWSAEKLAKLPKPVQSRAIKLILQSGGIEPSALRINTAREIIASGKGKFNPCRGKFFVVRRGAAYIEYAEQHYRKHEK